MEYLTQEQLSKVYLPKWPGCDVDGISVTPEQAMEILVRTNGTYFSTNDREFEKQVRDIFYGTIPHPEWGERWWGDSLHGPNEETGGERWNRWALCDDYCREMGLLNLEYLANQRVCSSYIGGPYGWCDWDGRIYQRGKNVGKWPSAGEIYDEWAKIAKAFPYLNLTCKLLDHEAGYGDEGSGIAVVYEVAEGTVKARTPIPEDLDSITGAYGDEEPNDVDLFIRNFDNPFSERGVSLDTWRTACNLVAFSQGYISGGVQ